jgi:hypothetical protein
MDEPRTTEPAERDTELEQSGAAPDRAEGAPSAWDPDRTGPSRDDEPAQGNVGRSEPWTETAESAEGGFRSDDDPQAGEVAKLPGT